MGWGLVKLAFQWGPLALWVFMLFALVRPLRLGWFVRWGLALAMLAAGQKFMWFEKFGGHAFLPDMPVWLINALGWADAWFVTFALLHMAAMAVRGVRKRVWRRETGLRAFRVQSAGLALAALAISGWGMWEGVRTPRVNRVEAALADLPAAFDGMRIVQLSDLHCSKAVRRERIGGIADRVMELKPDMICITGDFVDGDVEDLREELEPLRRLKAKYGVWGCTGNHEYYSRYGEWRPVFGEFGIRMLDNAHAVVTNGEARLVVAGMTDPAAGGGPGAPNLRNALAGMPAGECCILLQHQPYVPGWAEEREKVSLQLSGHTHGGAIVGLDLLVAEMGNGGMVRGFYRLGRTKVFVNAGTGQWGGFPLRLGIPSEISEITLRSAK